MGRIIYIVDFDYRLWVYEQGGGIYYKMDNFVGGVPPYYCAFTNTYPAHETEAEAINPDAWTTTSNMTFSWIVGTWWFAAKDSRGIILAKVITYP